nr:FlgD immunoglobulin-like domain containing protein [uncultured Treponema sp.]
MKKIQKIIFILIYTLLVTAAGFAETKTWVGGDSDKPTDWDTAANWSPSGVPTSSDEVVINSGGNQPVIENTVTYTAPATKEIPIKKLTINDNAILTIKSNKIGIKLKCNTGIINNGKITLDLIWSAKKIEFTTTEFKNTSEIYINAPFYGTPVAYDVTLKSSTEIDFKAGSTSVIQNGHATERFIIDTPVLTAKGTLTIENKLEIKNTHSPTGVNINISGSLTAKKDFTVPNNANTNITSSGTVNLEQSFIFSSIKWIASNGTIRTKGNFRVPNFEQNSGSLNLEGGSSQSLNIKQAYNLEIESLSTTSLTGNIKISNSLTNNGTFNAGNKTVTLAPSGTTVTITGTSTATNTKFYNLEFTSGGGKTLTINRKIFVENSLTLKGSDINNLLTIAGGSDSSAIKLYTHMGTGEWLNVKTNIPIESPYKYTTTDSKPYGPKEDLAAGKPYNWVFSSPAALIWTGNSNKNWNTAGNWVPSITPSSSTNVIIPRDCYNVPELDSEPPSPIYRAKHVIVESGARLYLKKNIITEKSLDNYGTVYMEGSAAQKSWLALTARPMFVHKDGSTIVYQNVTDPNAEICKGPYKKLEFASGVPDTIKAASLEVKEQLTVNKSITLDTGSGNQTYDGTINAGGYDVTLKGSTIKTKNVTAKKIKVTGTWNSQGGDITSETDIEAAKWTSWGGITAKNINITDELVFNGGIIRVGGNLTAKKLNASSNANIRGLIIFNGNGTQKLSGIGGNNIIDGKIQNLQIESTATLQLESDITITVGLNNQGVFDAVTNSKTVTLFHAADLPSPPLDATSTVTITGKTNKDDTKFHNLICTTTAGRLLKIDGEISVTGTLTLSGASGNLLTIYGYNDAKIHLSTNHDLDSSNNAKGNFLRIYTDSVKIQPEGKYYVVKDSKDDDGNKNSKNGWIFVKPNLTIVNSFAKPNDNHIYLLFNDTGLSLEEFKAIGSSNLTITDSGGTLLYSSSLENTVQSGRAWKIELNRPISVDDILTNTHKVKLKYFGTDKEKTYISDIGIDMVKPLKAFNSIVLYDFGAESDDPSLVTLDVTIPSVIAGSDDVKLYFISKDSPAGSFWYPNTITPPPQATVYANSQMNTHEYSPIPDGGANQIKFIIPSTDSYLVKDKVGQFMFVYKGWLPCARLKDPNNILSFDVWNFKIVGVQKQKGGVSVFNNVINPNKNQEATIGAHLKKSGMLTIQIMTLDGNVIRTLERSHKDAGDHFVNWDGRNNGGNPVASGMYFVRIAGPEIDEVRKILVVK